jgi:hypothetical protein
MKIGLIPPCDKTLAATSPPTINVMDASIIAPTRHNAAVGATVGAAISI